MTLVLEVEGHELVLRREEKVLYPDDGLTKADVVEHYLRVAERMLPHLRDRPLALRRWPDGIDRPGFFQKAPADHFPDWVTTVDLPKRDGGTKRRIIADDRATLAYLASLAVLELHTWTSRASAPERPDRLVIDMDPGQAGRAGWRQARRGALLLLDVLEDLGVQGFPLLTGSRGVHVVLPLDPPVPRERARVFADKLADLLVQRQPNTYTRALSKDRRGERLFVDTLRNAPSQTSVAPYSLRARPGAPVATPITRAELEDPELGPERFTLTHMADRLAEPDPWTGWDQAGVALQP